MPDVPTGTVTFLFTDVEGSTALWERDAEAMRATLERHDRIMRSAMARHNGSVFATGGDGFAVAFARAGDAIAAGVEAQIALRDLDETSPLKVRMGVHIGEAAERDGNYFGPTVNRAARIMAAGHGGQLLCSAVTAGIIADGLPVDCSLVELGVYQLRGLSTPERVHQITIRGSQQTFPALHSLDAFPGNLPIQPSEFVGREEETKDLVARLNRARVVTLTGVGGVGKTRLALQVAAEVLPDYRDGAWLVELAGTSSSDAVQEAVASTLGFRGGPGTSGGLLDYLRSKQLLLVLDNCEHVLESVASLVEQIASSTTGVRVLATSREGLGVAGEHVVTVASLGLPDPLASPEVIGSAESVRLFVERARAASASYMFTEADAQTLAELCRRLDGIPLAIELAAARVSALTPEEIAAHLDQRFKLLTGGRRAAVDRHQTLRNAIDWSYQLLDPDERSVLERLAAFSGGFDLVAAQSVAATEEIDNLEVLDVLSRLVDKSLVVADTHDRSTRYRMLETVRDFAWEHLMAAGQADQVGHRHAEHFAQLAHEAGMGLRGPEEAEWRERVQREVPNLRAALLWAIAAGDSDLTLRPVADLAVFGDEVAPYGLLAESAAQAFEDRPLSAVALGAACYAATMQGDFDTAWPLAEEAHRRADALDRTPEGLWVRCRVANASCTIMAYHGGDLFQFGQQWLADARELGDTWSIAEALTFLTGLLDQEAGVAAGEEALNLARKLDAPSRIAFAAVFLASRLSQDQPDRANQLLREAAQVGTKARSDWVDSVTSIALGQLNAAAGNFEQAAQVVLAAIDRSVARRARGNVVQFTGSFACLLASMGHEEEALLLATWAQQYGYVFLPNHPSSIDYGVTPLLAARAARVPAQLADYANQAAQLDDAAVARLARESLAETPDRS